MFTMYYIICQAELLCNVNFSYNDWHKQQGISLGEKSNKLIPCLLAALVTPVLSSL